MKVPMIDLQRQYDAIKGEIDSAMRNVLESGQYIMGKEVELFEREIDDYMGLKPGSSIGCASGSDALLLALMAIGVKEGDEVITTPFTFFATAGSIVRLGAVPVFVDIGDDYNIDVEKVMDKITDKTKAVISVSLYGNPASLLRLREICDEHGIMLIDDAAQAIGAKINNVHISHYTDISTYSFYPTKNLGAYGDGGMLIVNDKALADKVRMLRVHGAIKKYTHKIIGVNSRLDTIQAAILRVKLPNLDEWIFRRREIASEYDKRLSSVKTPIVHDTNYHVYHQYTIMSDDRDRLMENLKNNQIESQVYYPIALHLQECFSYLGYNKGDFPIAEMASEKALSIPINETMSDEEIEYVIKTINSFAGL